MSVKVNFKRGSQSSINTLINGSGNRFTEGTFYLTNDTNRLYFAQAANKLVDLNQYIRIKSLSSLNDLPNSGTTGYENLQSGDIYYWQNQNVLAICNDPVNGTWVQLNPDTYLTAASGTTIALTNGTNTVTINHAVTDSKGHSASGSFQIAGGSNVSVSSSNGVITISATDTNDNTTYTLGTDTNAAEGTVTLTPSSGAQQSITFAPGPGISVTSNNSGTITIGNASGAQGIKGVSNAFAATGAFVTTLEGVSTNMNSTAITPIIAYGENHATTAVFASGTANLDVYTKDEVDDLIEDELKAFDAMEYKGTVDSSDASTKLVSTANVGDTYKAASAINNVGGVSGNNAKTGDLIIAEGTDGNVTWEIVPSGDEQTITGSASGNTVSISDGAGVIAGIGVNGSTSTYGTISVTPSISGSFNTLTVAHGAAGTGTAVTVDAADASTTQASGNRTVVIPVVTSISKDAAGHVTAVSAQNYSLTDTHSNISSVTVGAAAVANNANDPSAGGKATISTTVADNDNMSATGQYRLTSNNLEISTTATTAGSATVYEVNVDLVWGSF